MINIENLCTVIVTYGNRAHLVKKVVERLIEEDVKKIFIVDNGSVENSRNELIKLKNIYKKRIELISLIENTGSAGGFKKGLEAFLKSSDCEYTLLLDDDNLPEKDFLKKLANIDIDFDKKKDALWIYRTDRDFFIDYIKNNKPDGMLPDKNGFCGMHIGTILQKSIKLIRKKLKRKKELKNIKIGNLYAVPYGGTILHKNLLEKIGFPNEEFFIYVDDYEWSYRITKNNGRIYGIFSIKIEDIDKSWHVKSKNKSFFYKIMNTDELKRTYYTIRNRVYFEKREFISNELLYNLNKVLFFLALSLYKRKDNKKQYKTVLKAIEDGLKGKLGKTI